MREVHVILSTVKLLFEFAVPCLLGVKSGSRAASKPMRAFSARVGNVDQSSLQLPTGPMLRGKVRYSLYIFRWHTLRSQSTALAIKLA